MLAIRVLDKIKFVSCNNNNTKFASNFFSRIVFQLNIRNIGTIWNHWNTNSANSKIVRIRNWQIFQLFSFEIHNNLQNCSNLKFTHFKIIRIIQNKEISKLLELFRILKLMTYKISKFSCFVISTELRPWRTPKFTATYKPESSRVRVPAYRDSYYYGYFFNNLPIFYKTYYYKRLASLITY